MATQVEHPVAVLIGAEGVSLRRVDTMHGKIASLGRADIERRNGDFSQPNPAVCDTIETQPAIERPSALSVYCAMKVKINRHISLFN